MAAIGITYRSTILRSINRTITSRNLISSKAKTSIQTPISLHHASTLLHESKAPFPVESERFLRRELSTHQPFHSNIVAACLVSKLSSDVTSYEGRFANYLSSI